MDPTPQTPTEALPLPAIAALLDEGGDAVIQSDLQGRITAWSQGAEKLYGRSARETVGRTLDQVLPESEPLAREARGGRSVVCHESEREIGDGRTVTVSTAVCPVRDADGQVVGVVSLDRDVSRRTSAEREAADQRRYVEAVFNATLHAVVCFACDRGEDGRIRDFRIMQANDAAARTFGVDRDQLVGKRLAELQPKVREAGLFDRYVQVVETGAPLHYELFYDADGITGTFDVSATRLGDGLVASFVDITQTKNSERQAHEIAEQFRATFEEAAVGVAHVGLDGRWLRVNRRLAAILGYPPDVLVGMTFHDLTHPDDLMKDLDLLSETLTGGRTGYHMQKRYFRQDASIVWADLSVSLIRDIDGNPRYFVSVIQDVTEQTLARQQLDEANRQLEATNQELEQFVYAASHDLKSPLVTMLGFAGRIRSDAQAGRFDRVVGYAEHMERAAERMRRNIDDLLEISRIGTTNRRPQEVDVAALVEEFVRDQRPQIEAAKATIEVDPATPTLVGDRVRIEQVIGNLLVNALRYGCTGQDRRIEVAGRRDRGMYQLMVRDHGEGIEPAMAEKIFGLFQRGSDEGDGTGVGLAIVRRIAQTMSGRAWVEPTPGGGATFRVCLRLNVA